MDIAEQGVRKATPMTLNCMVRLTVKADRDFKWRETSNEAVTWKLTCMISIPKCVYLLILPSQRTDFLAL